jgi:3-deoxy-D-manno-octulosonic-acid transferase
MRLRENSWREQLINFNEKFSGNKEHKKRIWFHAASMGEFEQAKSIIEIIKAKTDYEIIVSFFSPSGYENQLNYKYADYILYLPIDRGKNVKLFLDITSPDIAVFIRYEYWYNFLLELEKREIPSVMICGTEAGNKLLKKGIGKKIFQKIIAKYSRIYTMGKSHTEFFQNMNFGGKLITATDTRFDRIWEKVNNSENLMINKSNLKHKLTLVCGSTWAEDEKIIFQSIKSLSQEINLVIAPHEPTSEHINSLKNIFPNSILLSELGTSPKEFITEIIIVDSIGKLLSLYSLADFVYVGGGFGSGVHSLAEPAGYGLPLVCGGKIKSSPDAPILLEENALEIIHNHRDLSSWIENNFSAKYRTEIGNKTQGYIKSRLGWSGKIAEDLIKIMEKEI